MTQKAFERANQIEKELGMLREQIVFAQREMQRPRPVITEYNYGAPINDPSCCITRHCFENLRSIVVDDLQNQIKRLEEEFQGL